MSNQVNNEYLPDHFIRGFFHVGIVADEPKKIAQFYIDNFGFQQFYDKVRPDLELNFITGHGIMLEILSRGDQPQGGPVDHLCFEVMNIEALVEKLKANGVKFERDDVVTRNDSFVRGYKWIYCRGLADERIELFEFL